MNPTNVPTIIREIAVSFIKHSADFLKKDITLRTQLVGISIFLMSCYSSRVFYKACFNLLNRDQTGAKKLSQKYEPDLKESSMNKLFLEGTSDVLDVSPKDAEEISCVNKLMTEEREETLTEQGEETLTEEREEILRYKYRLFRTLEGIASEKDQIAESDLKEPSMNELFLERTINVLDFSQLEWKGASEQEMELVKKMVTEEREETLKYNGAFRIFQRVALEVELKRRTGLKSRILFFRNTYSESSCYPEKEGRVIWLFCKSAWYNKSLKEIRQVFDKTTDEERRQYLNIPEDLNIPEAELITNMWSRKFKESLQAIRLEDQNFEL